MSGYFDSQWGIYPPFGDSEAPGHRKPYHLTGTGTGEVVNGAPLSKDRMHILTVGGGADVLVSFRVGKDYSGTAVVAGAQCLLPAGSVYPFKAIDGGDYGSLFVHVKAADGAANFEVSIHQRD